MNSETWQPIELFTIAFLLLVMLSCLGLATWQACKKSTQKWIWRLIAALLWAGILLMASSAHNHQDPELPPVFAIGTKLLLAGIAGTVIVSLINITRRLWKRRLSSSASN